MRVSATNSDDVASVIIHVEDDGPGIEPDQAEVILARGVRADSSTEGQGIGLAVVRDIVEEIYGGEVSVSDSELGGARVMLRF